MTATGMDAHREIHFEDHIVHYLGEHGWLVGDADRYDRRRALYDGCQGSCRLSHATVREMGCCSDVSSMSARSGLRVTVSMTLQSRVRPLQRRGFAARAAS